MALNESSRSSVVIDFEVARASRLARRGAVPQKKAPRQVAAPIDADSGEPKEPVDLLARKNALAVGAVLERYLPAPDDFIRDDDETGW